MASCLKASVSALFLSLLMAFGARAQGNGQAVISTTNLNFGDQFTGESSAPQTVSLTNTGFSVVTQSSFLIGGANAADFALSTSCGILLPGGTRCILSAVFTPSALGPETALLTFTDLDSYSGLSYGQSIALTGTGVPAAVPASHSLILVSLFNGGPSGLQTINVSNRGSDALNQGSFLLSGPNASDFTLTTTCGTTFTAGGACSVSVLFTPASANFEYATLSFTDSDAGTGIPYTQSIALTGIPNPGLPGGVVEIIGKQSGKALDVLDASTTDGMPIEQYDFSNRSHQQWQFLPVETGYYKIQNVNSGKVLDVIAYSAANGAGIQQWDYLGTDNQKWQVTVLADGSLQITNKESGKLLDVTGLSTQNGTTMQQWASTGGDNQKWIVTAPQYFTVTSLNSNKVLDVSGYSLQDGGLIQQWISLGGANQLWQFVPLGNGYYEIVNRLSGKALDAVNPAGSPATAATLVQQYAYSGQDNQQWQLAPTGGGYYKIANKASGKVLDVIGISTTNGAGIQVYTYLGGSNQQWRLDPVSP